MKTLLLIVLFPLMAWASAYDMERADQVNREGWKLDFATDPAPAEVYRQHAPHYTIEEPRPNKIKTKTEQSADKERKGKMHL